MQDYSELMLDAAPIGTEFCRRNGKMKQPINIHVGATLFATVTWTPQGWMVQWTAGRKEGVDGLCEAMTLVGQTL